MLHPLVLMSAPVAYHQIVLRVKAVMDTHRVIPLIVFIVEKVGMKLQQHVRSPVLLVLMKSVMMMKFALDILHAPTKAHFSVVNPLKMHLNLVQHHVSPLMIVKLGKHASHSQPVNNLTMIFLLVHSTAAVALKTQRRHARLPAQAASMKIVQMGNYVIHTPPVASVIHSFVEQVGQMLPPVV
jgi:hypothetical protein